MVAFDVFRVRDGRLIEHWDALQAEVPQSKSLNGNSMVDGPTEVIERDKTETNRAIAIAMLDTVFIKGQFDRITDFVSTAMYRQHNPHAGNGLAGLNALVESLARQNLGFGYTRSPLIIADGNFVLAGSEGYFGPLDTKPYGVFYDLWRFENGKVVEHWDVVPTPAPDPANLPHRNGLF
jgi:predicted SnoaL-like aldol condensation-catalyzing enzyme